MTRRLVAAFIALSILYFPFGWLFVSFGFLNQDLYLQIAAIVGSLASITGLFAFIRPTISRDDINSLEIESINKVAESAKKVEELESQKEETKGELEQLTRTKQEMEALVKKAGMALFLREEQRKIEERILSKIELDSSLSDDLQEYRDYSGNIRKLDEEIEGHPDAVLLQDIVYRARLKKKLSFHELEKTFSEVPIFFALKPFVLFFIAYFKMLALALEKPRKKN